jgi:hypothetical protein
MQTGTFGLLCRDLASACAAPDLTLALTLTGFTAAALRYELADSHTYEFVQGILAWQMAPGN